MISSWTIYFVAIADSVNVLFVILSVITGAFTIISAIVILVNIDSDAYLVKMATGFLRINF